MEYSILSLGKIRREEDDHALPTWSVLKQLHTHDVDPLKIAGLQLQEILRGEDAASDP